MLTRSRLTPSSYICVKHCGSSRESHNWILQIWIGSCISRSPTAAAVPLDFWTAVHTESRGEAAICISHGASRPRRCRERERECHMSLRLAVEGKKINWRRILSRLTRAVIVSPQSSSSSPSVAPLSPPISLLLHLHPFFPFSEFLQNADPAWLQALISRASEPRVYWLGLQRTKQM